MDGVDVKEWNLAYLRDRVAIVSQVRIAAMLAAAVTVSHCR